MIVERIAKWWKVGPIDVPKTDLSSKVDKMLFHKNEALRLSDELKKEIAITHADLTTAMSRLVPTSQPETKATP